VHPTLLLVHPTFFKNAKTASALSSHFKSWFFYIKNCPSHFCAVLLLHFISWVRSASPYFLHFLAIG